MMLVPGLIKHTVSAGFPIAGLSIVAFHPSSDSKLLCAGFHPGEEALQKLAEAAKAKLHDFAP